MPRYLVERSFPDGLEIPIDDNGLKTVASVVATNADLGVTWVHSYVRDDNRSATARHVPGAGDAAGSQRIL